MASESSSAVLELNDGDVTEDIEAPSVTDDNDEAPLIMEHGYDIAVKVDSPLKQMSTLETFVTYRVRCVCARWPTPAHVRRRYNHFKVDSPLKQMSTLETFVTYRVRCVCARWPTPAHVRRRYNHFKVDSPLKQMSTLETLVTYRVRCVCARWPTPAHVRRRYNHFKVDSPLKQMSTLETFVTYRVRCVCARWPTPAHVRRRYNHFKVDSPLKQMSTLETFVTYRVRCVCARWPTPAHVRRRYNHFKVLHKRLSSAHPLVAAPPLPPLHSARQQLDRYSPAFVAVRTLALDAFLDRVSKHPILTHSDDLRLFLTTPDDEVDRVLKSDSGARALWGLTAFGADKPSSGPRVRDPEFSSAAEYLTSLQQKLTALCGLARALHRGHTAVARERMGMKRVCDAWATQAGGLASRGAAAVGAGAAAGVTVGGQNGGNCMLKARATLPLLAAYAAAHVEKIRQRDSLHASYVSGSNATGELHNRLEQASEALRSELADWIPKTRSEIKSLLLEIAERQVSIHKQTLMGWEHALKLSTEANVGDLFKTVSKNAVQNLSPSKYNATPTETEKDFDDLSNSSNDFEVSNLKSDIVSKGSNSPDNYEVVKGKLSLESEVSKNNGSTESYEVVKNCEGIVEENVNDEVSTENEKVSNVNVEVSKENVEVSKDGLKSELEVSTDPLRDFSEIDLSS